jgi:hypothetical protein
MIQNVRMNYMQTLIGVEFMQLLFAVGTLPILFITNESPHFGDGRPLFAPVLRTTGGLAAHGIPVSKIEVYSLTATIGTGFPGEAHPLFRSIRIPAIFTGYHDQHSLSGLSRIL